MGRLSLRIGLENGPDRGLNTVSYLIKKGGWGEVHGVPHSQNRREGNDQESIQLSHTSHQSRKKERNTNIVNSKALKSIYLIETSLAESETDSGQMAMQNKKI